MKIIFILVGLSLIFTSSIPPENTALEEPILKGMLFYVGVAFTLSGLFGLADWLETKFQDYKIRRNHISDNKKIRQ